MATVSVPMTPQPSLLVDAIEDARAQVAEQARLCGHAVLATGAHPFAAQCEPRRGRARAGTLLVAIAMPRRDHAERARQALRALAPMLVAMSANSPLEAGRDSGVASRRARGAWSLDEGCAARVRSHHVRIDPARGAVVVDLLDVQRSAVRTMALVQLIRMVARAAARDAWLPGSAGERLPAAGTPVDERRADKALRTAIAHGVSAPAAWLAGGQEDVPLEQALEQVLAAAPAYDACEWSLLGTIRTLACRSDADSQRDALALGRAHLLRMLDIHRTPAASVVPGQGQVVLA